MVPRARPKHSGRLKFRPWRREQTRAVLSRITAEMLAQIGAGDGGAGSLGAYKAGPRAGAPITLRRTGRLLASIRERLNGRSGTVRPSVRHALFVARRFPGVFTLGAGRLEAVRALIRQQARALFQER